MCLSARFCRENNFRALSYVRKQRLVSDELLWQKYDLFVMYSREIELAYRGVSARYVVNLLGLLVRSVVFCLLRFDRSIYHFEFSLRERWAYRLWLK